jgi:hypothetical protein
MMQAMSNQPTPILTLARQPSAFLPMMMSVAALAVLTGYLTVHGIPARHSDEGATAHTWQLLIGGQLPVIVYFAFKWLRMAPRAALGILGIQLALGVAAIAPVYVLGL